MVLAVVALWALLASLLVGCASFTVLALVPLLLAGSSSKSNGSNGIRLPAWLTVALTSVAVGAMLGDVLVHQLPHVLEQSSHSHHTHAHHNHAHELVHVHDHSASQALAWGTFASMLLFLIIEHVCHNVGGHDTHIHSYETRSRTSKRASHTPTLLSRDVGWLNLVADGVHNFTDGLAIGTGFAQGGVGLGMARTWAILLHELPQEFGDFTILLSAGFSVKEALTWNFVSALTSVLGTIVALLASGSAYQHPALSNAVAGVTVGGFLYLSITILNELARSSSVRHLAIVLCCCCAGFGLIATVHVPH